MDANTANATPRAEDPLAEMTPAEAARWYAKNGFPIFPIYCIRNGMCSCGRADCEHPGKHPKTAHGFHDATKDPRQIEEWWTESPDANIAIATGAVSGLLVLDIDPRHGGEESLETFIAQHGPMPQTAEQLSGGGGRHIFLRDPGIAVPKELAPGIDIKGSGGYIILAPSIHASGRHYIWDGVAGACALFSVASVPEWLLTRLVEKRTARPQHRADSGAEYPEGERNDRLTSLAGTMRRRGMTEVAMAAALLEENRQKCRPPLGEAEVRRIAHSVVSYQPAARSPKKKPRTAKDPIPFPTKSLDEAEPPTEDVLNQAQTLISLAADAKLFRTPSGEAFAEIRVDDHYETLLLQKKAFKAWLVRRFYQELEKPPSSQALQGALGVLDAKALFDGQEETLFTRVAEYGDRIYIDLCDRKWRVVEISAEGWRVISNPPIHFRRAGGMKSLPLPVAGGSIRQLRTLLNIGSDSNWILCMCWLVATCRAKGPFPVLIFQGEQGSAKSTMVKLLRMLIDPSCALVRTPPRDSRDLAIAANNSWVLAYDNLSGIFPWLSDAFCRLATGEGFSTRALYTNDEEVFFDSVRPIVLNGIDHLAERPDLAQRALILNLPRIPNEKRRDEATLYADFERQVPQILGALFSAVSSALARLPQTKLETLPRMADFALLATAAEQGLGFAPGSFMRAYEGNQQEAVQETLEADPVGAAILGLMDPSKCESFEGSYKELFRQLEQHIDEGTKKSKDWPKSARGLSGRLRRLVTFFRDVQIQIAFHPRGAKGQRTVTISRTGLSSVTTGTTVTSSQDHPLNQTFSAKEIGDGPAAEVTKQEGVYVEPSPGPTPPNPFRNTVSTGASPEVTEVTVDRTNRKHDPAYVCSNCGLVEWIWNGSAWVCPECGSLPNSNSDIERFEI